MRHQLAAEIETMWSCLESIDERDPMPPPELVSLWLDLKKHRRYLDQVLHAVHDDAAVDVAAEKDERDEYVSSGGEVVHLTWRPRFEHWRGFDFSDRLAVDMVDPNGEIVRAIPLDVIRRFVPGCAMPDLTSSRWRTTGLAQLVPDWENFRSVGPRDPTLNEGTRYRSRP